jgi:hypothetical protein
VGWRLPEELDVIDIGRTKRVVVTNGMLIIGDALADTMGRVRANGGLRTRRKPQ